MNTLLTKHVETESGKTHAQSVEAYERAWENAKYLLRPLAKMLEERVKVLESIKDNDFETPNHYAKLMFYMGKKEEAVFLKSLLPKSLEG